jgi:hypothetical protein
MWPHLYHHKETASHVSMGLGTQISGFKPGLMSVNLRKIHCQSVAEFRRVPVSPLFRHVERISCPDGEAASP